MKDLAGKVAFVTGGASGIGLGIADAFVEAGMKVVLADLRQDRIDDALAWFEGRGHGASVHGVQVDVTAVVAISETIRTELAREGIGVSVVCPGPVRTNIREIVRPPQFGVGEAFRAFEQAGGTSVTFPSQIEPAQVGALVLQGIRNDELYVITHGEWRGMAIARYSAIVEAMPKELDPSIVEMLRLRTQALGAGRRDGRASGDAAHCEQR